MKRIQFSELVNRQRRNLMGAAFLMIGVVHSNIQIKDGAVLGLSLDNFDTRTALTAILVFLLYHLIIFSMNAWEEYQLWRLTFVETGSSLSLSGSRVHEISDILENFALGPDEKPLEAQSEDIRRAVVALNKFAAAFNQFPKIVKFRFWVLDVGLAVGAGILATAFYGNFLLNQTSTSPNELYLCAEMIFRTI